MKRQEDQERDEAEDDTPVTKLTGLVDQLVDDGEFEIYGYTYEKINFQRDKLGTFHEGDGEKEDEDGGNDEDDDLDMFAADIDKNRLAQPQSTTADSKTAAGAAESDLSVFDEVRWEFKWENKEDVQVHGPCSTEQMQAWVDQGYFDKGVWVRRTGQENAQFYSSKRIDFELYM